MIGEAARWWSGADELRRLVPVFAVAVAVVAVFADPSSAAETALAVVPVAAFLAWSGLRRVPLGALSLAVVVPVVLAQRSGDGDFPCCDL